MLAVDDQPHFRSALLALIEATWAAALVREAESGEAAVVLARELEPDVVLMDVRMDGIGGVRAAHEIKGIRPGALVLLISTVHPHELTREASECPADGIVWKGDLCPRLLSDLWATHLGSGRDG